MPTKGAHPSNLVLDKEGNVFKDCLRLSIKPIWNSFNFFTIYANADNLTAKYDLSSDNIIYKENDIVRLYKKSIVGNKKQISLKPWQIIDQLQEGDWL